MPKVFSEKNRVEIREHLLTEGFAMLRAGGLGGVNIDKLCVKCYIAKGTFYHFFETKYEFIYHMMIHERLRSKKELSRRLNGEGKLSNKALRKYLIWLRDENPNVFSYLTEPEKKRIVAKWLPDYLKNEENDEQTMSEIIKLLETPKKDPDWKNACNLMKILAVSLTMTDIFITEVFGETTEILIDNIISCITEKKTSEDRHSD